jgi:hypothetical protein
MAKRFRLAGAKGGEVEVCVQRVEEIVFGHARIIQRAARPLPPGKVGNPHFELTRITSSSPNSCTRSGVGTPF